MRKIIVSEDIFELYEELHLGVVICENISNNNVNSTRTLLEENIFKRKQALAELDKLADLKVVKEWRNAYKKFKEKKNRSSIESLLRRIHNNKEISCINPLVDIYNAASIKYLLPCGGEDMDKIEQDMELTLSDGKEIFIPFGSNEEEKPNINEVIYKSGNLVVCRCFNWREADFSKLTTDTENAVLIMECINLEDVDTLKEALNYMGNTVTSLLGGTCKSYILNKNNPILAVDNTPT